jgi:hypothetical protein
MAVRAIRSTFIRLVLIAGLAVALFVSSISVGQPTDASAAPMSCAQAIKMSHMYIAIGDAYSLAGMGTTAAAYYGRAQGVLEAAC